MKKNLTALWALCFTQLFLVYFLSEAQAQYRSAIDVQEWPKGKVVLVSGDTLYGALTYYRTQDVINVLHEDGALSSLSPVNVEYFVAQEMPSGRSYTFRTLRWDMGKAYSDFKKPTFFEVLNQGALTLIMRESYIRRDAGNMSGLRNNYFYDPAFYQTGGANFTDQVRELYYILLPNGEIVGLRNLRKDLHALFGDKSKEVKSYVKSNKLDYEKPHQLVAIINYFNTISNSTSSVH